MAPSIRAFRLKLTAIVWLMLSSQAEILPELTDIVRTFFLCKTDRQLSEEYVPVSEPLVCFSLYFCSFYP